ncbi:hypothetical protein, partial [Flavonifractor plautii]|uniref:hypothetical protein n=1 Tax=Flavonifractor plautii TaxID=292800 RepID=UPI003D7CB891
TIRSIPLELVPVPKTDDVDVEKLLPYIQSHELSHKAPSPRGTPSQSPEKSLGEKLEAEFAGSDGSNLQERIRQEAQSILEWGMETGRIIDP